MGTILAGISPLVIGVISIGVMLIALNVWLCIMLARQIADSWRILLNCLGLVERPQPWVAPADAGRPTRFSDDWTTSGAGSISGSRTTGSASRT
jgi:hypothetical protein